jgi:L-aminopeptidase/D-esterase-like protein
LITQVRGVRVGHWTDPEARTGCTVVLLPPGTVASGEVRGGAPGTREFELLAPHRLVTSLDAVVLTGGSAFGLAACDGVVRWCEENGRGFITSVARVPIVVGAVIFDLAVGDPNVRPGPEQGYAACEAASDGDVEIGQVGAGTGATIGTWRGPGAVRLGGLGGATERDGDLVVSALMVVNAVGDLAEAAGSRPPLPPAASAASAASTLGENTTIGVVVTNASLDKTSCFLVAQSGHDGLARALEPAHLSVDGDAVVACATAEVETRVDRVRILAARAVESAIRAAVGASPLS